MELNDVLRKVRALVATAEHPDTPDSEAKLARATADRLMLKYAVDEATIDASRPAAVRMKPTKILIDIGLGDSPFLGITSTLAKAVADHTRCQSIWLVGSGWGSHVHQEQMEIYGFESDVKYFEVLFTTLYLHMSGAIFPQPDPAKSLGENAWFLHDEIGNNWLEIAAKYGWRKLGDRNIEGKLQEVWRNGGEQKTNWQLGGSIKRAYQKYVDANNLPRTTIAAGASRTKQKNAALGYVAQINKRLMDSRRARGGGAEVALVDRADQIKSMILDDHPEMRQIKGPSLRYDPEAYGRGVRHANAANLNNAATSGKTGELQ